MPTTSKNTPRVQDSQIGDSDVSHLEMYGKDASNRDNTENW